MYWMTQSSFAYQEANLESPRWYVAQMLEMVRFGKKTSVLFEPSALFSVPEPAAKLGLNRVFGNLTKSNAHLEQSQARR